jgi:F0F1-type ATP synthase membrane subunit b/b'
MPAVAYVAAGDVVAVRLPRADTTTTVAGETAKSGSEATTAETTTAVKDPSPLTIAPKELFWSLGSFIVLLALMRLVFYPKLHGGMTTRQDHIATRLADADATKAAAQAEVADYQVAELRAEGQAKVDEANRTIDAERAAAMAEANAAIAQQRFAANAEVEAAKAAVAGGVAEAARDVVTSAAQRVLGQEPDASIVASAVDQAMSAGVAR